MYEILNRINYNVKICCMVKKCYSSHTINVHDVNKAISTIKKGKVDGNYEHYSDHLINGSIKIKIMLAMLFQSMLNHGSIPKGMLQSTIIPIPKGKNKSLNNSNNYRGIALSSIIGKVFDRIILTNHWSILSSSDMQFGFKPKHSTTQCTMVINEVIQYYSNNDSNIYVCMLDATKAFDRVEYTKLFKLMLSKGICFLVARVLAGLYTNQTCNVKWANNFSKSFLVSNGVKQGGILSPILFAIYMDELFAKLQSSGFGCHIGSLYCGCFGFADDATLLSPSINSLKLMLNVVDRFGEEYKVKFNPDKCQLISYSPNNVIIDGFHHENTFIKNEKYAIHLGNVIGYKLYDKNIYDVTDKFICSVNFVLSTFKHCFSFVKYNLFKTYCMSLYGAMLWDFSSSSTEHFFTQWRKSVRRVWKLPATTHCKLLNLISEDFPVETQLHNRFINFYVSLLKNNNIYVKTCVKLAKTSSSKFCNSINYMQYKYNIDKNNISTIVNITSNVQCSESDLMVAGNVLDLCYLRDTRSSHIRNDEINTMLQFLCTS